MATETERGVALELSRDEARWLRKVVSHIGRRYDDPEARVLHDRLDRLINPQDYAHSHDWRPTGTIDTGHQPPFREWECDCGAREWTDDDDGPEAQEVEL